MKIIGHCLLVFLLLESCATTALADAVKETALGAANNVKIKVRMEGPSTAVTPLQVVCIFKHKPSGDKMLGAALELDKELRGVLSALRNRGEFAGDALESLLIVPPSGAIKPKLLLLIGIGDEDSLSLERMEGVGRVALREAARLGVSQVAFAPLIRDQGDSRFATGDIAHSVVRGVLSAYDTELRLRKEGLAKPYTLEQWSEEAGAAYFDETVNGAKKAIEDAADVVRARPTTPLASP